LVTPPFAYFAGKKNSMLLFDEVDFIQTQSLPLNQLWYFLPVGYLFTILVETPVLLLGLPPIVRMTQRLRCGIWLTACTYPIVILVLPAIFLDSSRTLYLAVAETFAPAAECLLFWIAFRGTPGFTTPAWVRSFFVITLANLASFGFGEIMNTYGWFGLF
jgi:hypothetical protein